VSKRKDFLAVVTVTPNFALLEMSHPEVASLVAAMLQARDAVERRSRGRKRRLSKTDEASAPRIEAVPARCWAPDDSRSGAVMRRTYVQLTQGRW
jgi:hypothetical protein